MGNKRITPEQAAALVKDGMTLAVGGFMGFGIPESLLVALQDRYRKSGSPKDLTAVHIAAVGDGKEAGANHLGEEGLLKKLVCGHIGLEPALNRLTVENKIASYLVPQGVLSHLMRAIAGKKVGVLTHVGLKTFADPRLEGCKMNDKARSGGDVVELLTIAGKEQLLYHSFPVDICFIRGSYADEDGNITLHREAAVTEQLEMASAAHNSGGIVVVQVEKIVQRGSFKPHDVKIHGLWWTT